jgi:nicotinate-nucleotide adenylyltransferase
MEQQLRIGLFGGSFDPVHWGHIKLACAAKKELQLDKIFFIPAKIPPHKMQKKLSSAKKRLEMLRMAIAPYPCFFISLFELKQPHTTYTYQTVACFRKRYPNAALFFIIGGDSLNELSTWKNIGHLLTCCTFVAGKRAGVQYIAPRCPSASVQLLETPLPKVSSSEIRQKVREGKSIHRLVPPAIERYIKEHKLYD